MNSAVMHGMKPHVKVVERCEDGLINHHIDPVLVKDNSCTHLNK